MGCLRLRHNSTLLDLLCLILEDTLSAERISGYTLIDSLVIQRVHSHWQVVSAVLQESSTCTSIEGWRWTHVYLWSLRRHYSREEFGQNHPFWPQKSWFRKWWDRWIAWLLLLSKINRRSRCEQLLHCSLWKCLDVSSLQISVEPSFVTWKHLAHHIFYILMSKWCIRSLNVRHWLVVHWGVHKLWDVLCKSIRTWDHISGSSGLKLRSKFIEL